MADHGCDGLVVFRSWARVLALGVPETLSTDRRSKPSLGCMISAAPSRPYRRDACPDSTLLRRILLRIPANTIWCSTPTRHGMTALPATGANPARDRGWTARVHRFRVWDSGRIHPSSGGIVSNFDRNPTKHLRVCTHRIPFPTARGGLLDEESIALDVSAKQKISFLNTG